MAENPGIEVDLAPLTAAIAKVAEDMARKLASETLPSLIKPEAEESLKAMAPGLIEKAVAEEKVLIKETVQEVTRQVLPGIIEEELRKLVDKSARDIIEKVAREIVPDHAETAVKKEIERLTAEV